MTFLSIRFYTFSQETDSETKGSSHILYHQHIHRKEINAIARVWVTHKQMHSPSRGESKMKQKTFGEEQKRRKNPPFSGTGSFSGGICDLLSTCQYRCSSKISLSQQFQKYQRYWHKGHAFKTQKEGWHLGKQAVSFWRLQTSVLKDNWNKLDNIKR